MHGTEHDALIWMHGRGRETIWQLGTTHAAIQAAASNAGTISRNGRQLELGHGIDNVIGAVDIHDNQ
eukprot:6514993-Pyramimonas_sp.AAC.1